MAKQYPIEDAVIWTMRGNGTVLGFTRQLDPEDEDCQTVSEQFAADVEAAGWMTGVGDIIDSVVFVSLVHACGEPMKIEPRY